ncbi:MAG TPA: alpha/beta hydrolase [Tepidisphaeraceae bacterium]|nr:alpha/beta hydrolase [Tepidisphaeraceae bacterium]
MLQASRSIRPADGVLGGVTTALVGCVVLALCGCDISTSLRPMPVIYGPGGLELCSIIPESQRTRDLQVFYATNRKPEGPPEHRKYGNDVGPSLRLGIATVQMGKDGDTWDSICQASSGRGGDPKFNLVRSAESSDAAPPWDAINRQLALTPNREVNIYVHGYYTSFDVAVELLAKMLHCSGRRGVMVGFSWPARQNLYLYADDVARARASAHHLADLIEQVATYTGAENINLLSYSVGATCATDALMELRRRHRDMTPEQLARNLRIGNVIYAASDIDLVTFGREQIVEIKRLAQNVIVYVSQNDTILNMASVAAGGDSRLGRPDVTKFTKEEQEAVAKDPQIQVIDVSDVPGPQGFGGLGGHYYWYTNDWVMTDVLVGCRWQISPDQRGLYQKPGMSRWYFPKDYPERVTAAVKHLTIPTAGPVRAQR